MTKLQEFLNRFKLIRAKSEEIVKDAKAKENLNSTDWLNGLRRGGVGGWKSKFISDVYEERILYPHEEMEIAKKIYLYNAYVHAGVTALNYFLLGGELKVSAKNSKTENYLNDKLRTTGLKIIAMQYMFLDLVGGGNFYTERMYQAGKIVAYDYIPDYEMMYHQIDEKGFVEFYVQRIPEEQIKGDFITINYYGDRTKSIKGKKIEKKKIFHMKIGTANIKTYGRGLVAPVVNDAEILLEVERSMAVIARYKSIPKKLLMLMKANGPKDAEEIANALNNVGDDENPIIPFEMKVEDLSYAGKDLNTQPITDYLKKKLTVALAPSFLLHGDETTYAVAKEQRVALELKVNSIRANATEQLKRELRLMASLDKISITDFEIEYGTYDLGQNDEDRKAAIESFNAGISTLNESRELVGLDPDEENGEFYSFELKDGKEEPSQTPSETEQTKGKKNL